MTPRHYTDRAIDPPNEAAFTTMVIQLARYCGWKVSHARPALRQSGRYSTALQGDAGAPDILCAKDGRVVLMELKTATGRVAPEQQEWLEASGGHLFRPRDWPRICEILGEGRIEYRD